MRNAERILIVEDDPDIQDILVEMLTPLCQAVKSAFTAHEAETLLKDATLVICDQLLENGNRGLDLYRICRERYPATPFLLMSGLPDEIFDQLVSEGVDCPPFLMKPFTRAQLQATLEEALLLKATQRAST